MTESGGTMAATKKVRLTRSILLEGQDAEAGTIHELPLELADWLISMGSAEPLGVVERVVDRMLTPSHGDPRASRR